MNIVPRFHPAWWLSNAHAQTIWPTLFRKKVLLSEKWERVETPDGDFLDLVQDGAPWGAQNAPFVFLFVGFEGNIHSHYAKGLMRALTSAGFRPVLMHYRGCSGIPNRFAKGYHSGDTADMNFIIRHFHQQNPQLPIFAIGISLGANALLKWLGETGSNNPLRAAVAVSPPFRLDDVANRLMHGSSKIYQWWLLNAVKKRMKKKFQVVKPPFDLELLDRAKNFWEFDDWITAPLHGFRDVHEYYQQASCRQYLSRVRIPTQIIHAKDDPFMYPRTIPDPSELSPEIEFVLTDGGGHVGFISDDTSGYPKYWLEEEIPSYLSIQLDSKLDLSPDLD